MITGQWGHRALLAVAAPDCLPAAGSQTPAPCGAGPALGGQGLGSGASLLIADTRSLFPGLSLLSLVENVLTNWSSVSAAASMRPAADPAARPASLSHSFLRVLEGRPSFHLCGDE